MTWSDFVTYFQAEFTLAIGAQQLVREFQDMFQTTETVVEMTAKFRERALLVPQYAADEEIMKTRYHEMLRSDIREFFIYSVGLKLEDMISKSQEQEIDLEHIGRRKEVHVHVIGGS